VKERKAPRLAYRYGVTTTGNDTVPYLYTINRHDFSADSWRQLGVRVEMDKGDGVLFPLTQSERTPSLSITGSLDGYGVREVTFGKIPNESPLRSRVGARRVKVTGVRGTTGGYREWPLFDGTLRDASHEVFPPIGGFSAQDSTALNEPLFYTLPARSYTSRRAVIADICARYGIPVGTFTFLDAGNVGGYTVKGINEPGDRTVLSFLAEYLIPTTCRAYWRDGALSIRHFNPSDTPVKPLTWSDIRSIRPIPPAANAANTVRLASEIYPYVGPDVTGTTIVETTTAAAYTTVVATHRQNRLTGAITALGLTGTALGTRVATRTTTVYSGGTITTQTVETYGAYAPKACNKKLNADGSTRYNEDFDVYLFPDGSWRTVQEESWQVISKTVKSRVFDANGALSYEVWDQHDFVDYAAPNAQYNGAAWIAQTNRYVKDDGSGWLNGKEQLLASFRVTVWGSYATGTQARTSDYYEIRALFVSTAYFITGVITSGTFSLGPTASPTYCNNSGGSWSGKLLETWQTTYTQLSATSYRAVRAQVQARPNYYQASSFAVHLTAFDTTYGDPIPTREYLTSVQVPQPCAIVTPSLSGAAITGKRIADYTEAGWCETRAEMEDVGLEYLRELAAVRLAVEVDVDFEITEGSVITLPAHERLGFGPVDVLVRSQTIDLDAESCTGTQRLECWWYPPEVA
jgi:hypothetical protein